MKSVLSSQAAHAYAERLKVTHGKWGVTEAEVLAWGVTLRKVRFWLGAVVASFAALFGAVAVAFVFGQDRPWALEQALGLIVLGSFIAAPVSIARFLYLVAYVPGGDMEPVWALGRDIKAFKMVFGESRVLRVDNPHGHRRIKVISDALVGIIESGNGNSGERLGEAVDVAVKFFEINPDTLYRMAYSYVEGKRRKADRAKQGQLAGLPPPPQP